MIPSTSKAWLGHFSVHLLFRNSHNFRIPSPDDSRTMIDRYLLTTIQVPNNFIRSP